MWLLVVVVGGALWIVIPSSYEGSLWFAVFRREGGWRSHHMVPVPSSAQEYPGVVVPLPCMGVISVWDPEFPDSEEEEEEVEREVQVETNWV